MLPAEIKRHRFTVEEYHDMAATGLLTEDDRVELIDGEIVEMSPIGWCHANCVTTLTMLLARFALDLYVVSVQNPVTIGEYGELQPDLTLLEQTTHGRLPGPDDVSLAVEVSDSTLSYDKNIKLPRYAQAGVPEVWIVDLENQRVEVHSEPSPNGYHESKNFGPGETVTSANVENLSVPVNDTFA
jgi:Uma2 family endonuclease